MRAQRDFTRSAIFIITSPHLTPRDHRTASSVRRFDMTGDFEKFFVPSSIVDSGLQVLDQV
jgi:hypothetical protein